MWLVFVETFFPRSWLQRQGRASRTWGARACAFRAYVPPLEALYRTLQNPQNAVLPRRVLKSSTWSLAGQGLRRVWLLAMALSNYGARYWRVKSTVRQGLARVECRGAVFQSAMPAGGAGRPCLRGFSLRQWEWVWWRWWCRCLPFRFVGVPLAPCCGNPCIDPYFQP